MDEPRGSVSRWNWAAGDRVLGNRRRRRNGAAARPSKPDDELPAHTKLGKFTSALLGILTSALTMLPQWT